MGYILTVLTTFTNTLIPAFGMYLLLSMGGVLFLAAPAMIAVAAYAYAIPLKAGWGVGACMAISLLVTLIMGGIFILLQRRLNDMTFKVLSFASMLGVESMLSSWNSLTNGVQGLGGLTRPALFSSTELYSLQAVIVFAFFWLLTHLFLQSKYGRYLRANKEHKHALSSLGISHNKVLAFAFIFASLCFAVGGWQYIWKFRVIAPSSIGLTFLVQILTIVIIATKPKLRWLFLGGAITVFIPEIFRFIDLPTETFGFLRALFYSGILVFIVVKYNDKISIFNRKV